MLRPTWRVTLAVVGGRECRAQRLPPSLDGLAVTDLPAANGDDVAL